MDERKTGTEVSPLTKGPSHYGPSALSPGLVNGITNYLMRSLPSSVLTVTHESDPARLCATGQPFVCYWRLTRQIVTGAFRPYAARGTANGDRSRSPR